MSEATGGCDRSGAARKRLLLANPRGFCAGVERAIAAVERALEEYGPPVYVRRHIVHNQGVVDALAAKGAVFVRELAEVPQGAVTVLSAHGVPQAVLREAAERQLRTLDTTCPLVAKVHGEVVDHYHAGRHILLIGHQGHPEIVGTLGQVPRGAISVIGSLEDLAALSLPANTSVAFAVQTTFSVQDSADIGAAILARFADVAAPRSSDICYATTNRQAAIEAIAAQADRIVVVGDRLSSNAKRLTEVARAAGCAEVALVDDAAALDPQWLDAARIVGLTAAASTPPDAVNAVCERLEALGFVAEESEGRRETAEFKPVAMTPIGELSLPERMETVRRDIERCLDKILRQADGRPSRLNEAMRYAVLGGGKRMRGLLTVLVAEMLGADYRQAVWVASAVECLHAQSLVHDDLPCMDDDDYRRGKPSLHRRFDEATAVLAGDALLALAFEMLADDKAHPDGSVRARLVLALARTIGKDGLALGQMMDLYPPPDATADEIARCEDLKTGVLLGYCVEAGTLLAGCDDEDRRKLIRFSEKLGLAFQIRDDILDRIGDESEVGKRLRKDRQSGRRTAVDAWGLDGARDHSIRLAASCRDELASFGQRARLLQQVADFAVTRMH